MAPAGARRRGLFLPTMAYVTSAQLRAALPPEMTAQLLDDHGTGEADSSAWSEIQAAVQTEIDGKVGMRYPVPFTDPAPAVIRNAAFILAAELIYQRKGFFNDGNPWTKRAQDIRGTQGQQGGQPGLLDRIASGEVPLTASAPRARPAGAIIAEPAKTTPRSGHMLV